MTSEEAKKGAADALKAAEDLRDRLEELKIGAPHFRQVEIDADITHATRQMDLLNAFQGHATASSVVINLDASKIQELETLAAKLDKAIVDDTITSASLDMVQELLAAVASLGRLEEEGNA